jgi:protein SCO1/2
MLRHVLLAALLVFGLADAGATEWRRNYFPNVILTDQDGKKHRFYDDLIKDKIVTINFMFTTCKDICPLDTANLLRVQEMLGDRVGKNVFMYSISIDPENDSPAALKRYMQTYGVKPGWMFLTGKKSDVDLLISKLAMKVTDPASPRDHDTSIRLGNEKLGQWLKRSVFDDPKILANLLTDTLTNYDISLSGTHKGYDAAPEVKLNSRGEYLYRTRCQACHTMGGGDRLGPDLANVASARPRPWLRRWLKEPDKMIEEGDPLAVALLAQYKNLPMPNFGFGDVEVDALIAYMEEMDKKREAGTREGKAAN